MSKFYTFRSLDVFVLESSLDKWFVLTNGWVSRPHSFITTCGAEGEIKNQVGLALAQRIVRAAQSGHPFKIVVSIPCIPGFAGNLDSPPDSSGTLAIMEWTYKSICRGENSIFHYVEKAGFNPRDYITFYNLRNFDRINNDHDTLNRIEEETGISYYMTQAALARIYLGEGASNEELEKNKSVRFKLAQRGEGVVAGKMDLKARDGKTIEVPLPKSLEEAHDQLRRWSAAAPRYDRQVVDSVTTQTLPGGLHDLPWLGDEESEREAYVSEELYIHSESTCCWRSSDPFVCFFLQRQFLSALFLVHVTLLWHLQPS